MVSIDVYEIRDRQRIADQERPGLMSFTHIIDYFNRQSKSFQITLDISMMLVIGFVDYVTGYEIGLSLFYLIPIIFAAWFGSKRQGIVISALCLITMAMADYWAGKVYTVPFIEYWNLLMHLGFFVIISLLFSRLKVEFDERRNLINKLENAVKEIKQLSGLLPICASCKKIRDDKGCWNQIETYISKHSEAEFTHSICPECAKKLYPEVYKKIFSRNE
ncbi:MAG: hypothetical protein ACHQ0Y_09610 [Thermodesulfovibrionales bacterium]